MEHAGAVGLRLTLDGPAVTVKRLPGWAAYPRPPASLHWDYEDWVVHVSNDQVQHDRFLHGEPDRAADDRRHLYGNLRRARRHP